MNHFELQRMDKVGRVDMEWISIATDRPILGPQDGRRYAMDHNCIGHFRVIQCVDDFRTRVTEQGRVKVVA